MYSEAFKKLVKELENETICNYIGHGNPNSEILILAKEPAIDLESDSFEGDEDYQAKKAQYKLEVSDNKTQWLENIKNNVCYEELFDSCCDHDNYNPLFPYRGQQCQIRSTVSKVDSSNKTEKIIRGEKGTSRTWVAYQKLCDKIYFKSPKGKEDKIDFHEYIFTSDFSDEVAKMSSETNLEKTQKSISLRTERLFKSDFFQAFPIVIVAAGHYPRDHKIDLEKLFNVEWKPKTCKVANKFINVHCNADKSKLVIHTNQLSFYSCDLLDKISAIVHKFRKSQGRAL